jgi:hypothetical protein
MEGWRFYCTGVLVEDKLGRRVGSCGSPVETVVGIDLGLIGVDGARQDFI